MFTTNSLTGSLAGPLIDAAVGVLTAAAVGAGMLLPGTMPPPQQQRSGDSVAVERIHAQLQQLVDDHDVTAALVRVADGRSAYSDAVGVRDLESDHPAAANGYFRIGSITKTFVATVALQLVDEGRLRLDDPVERYLPGEVPDGDRITVRQILNHTSGIYDYAHDPGHSTNRWRGEARFDDYTPQQLLDVAFAHEPYFEPGQGWNYSNTNYIVAALLIERLTGRPYGEEIERRILRPLHLRHTSVPGHRATLPRPHARGYEPVTVDGEVRITDVTDMDPSLDWAAGEMVSTTADVDRFFDVLLTGRLLSPRSLAEMRRTVEAAPGLFRYGLGLQEFTLPCPTGPRTVVGHTGELVGYITVAMRDSSGRRLVLALNPYEQEPSVESVLGIAVTALCPQG